MIKVIYHYKKTQATINAIKIVRNNKYSIRFMVWEDTFITIAKDDIISMEVIPE